MKKKIEKIVQTQENLKAQELRMFQRAVLDMQTNHILNKVKNLNKRVTEQLTNVEATLEYPEFLEDKVQEIVKRLERNKILKTDEKR